MKILLLSNEYPPNIYGGAGVHVAQLTRAIRRLPSRKHTIDVLCFEGKESKGESDPACRIAGPGAEFSGLRRARFLEAL